MDYELLMLWVTRLLVGVRPWLFIRALILPAEVGWMLMIPAMCRAVVWEPLLSSPSTASRRSWYAQVAKTPTAENKWAVWSNSTLRFSQACLWLPPQIYIPKIPGVPHDFQYYPNDFGLDYEVRMSWPCTRHALQRTPLVCGSTAGWVPLCPAMSPGALQEQRLFWVATGAAARIVRITTMWMLVLQHKLFGPPPST